jgi:hypothetical protein
MPAAVFVKPTARADAHMAHGSSLPLRSARQYRSHNKGPAAKIGVTRHIRLRNSTKDMIRIPNTEIRSIPYQLG